MTSPVLEHQESLPLYFLANSYISKKKNHKFTSIKHTNGHSAYFSFSFSLGQQKGVDRNIVHSWSYGHLCCPCPCHRHYRVSLRSSAGLPSADPGVVLEVTLSTSTCWVPTLWPVLGLVQTSPLLSLQMRKLRSEVTKNADPHVKGWPRPARLIIEQKRQGDRTFAPSWDPDSTACWTGLATHLVVATYKVTLVGPGLSKSSPCHWRH